MDAGRSELREEAVLRSGAWSRRAAAPAEPERRADGVFELIEQRVERCGLERAAATNRVTGGVGVDRFDYSDYAPWPRTLRVPDSAAEQKRNAD